MVEWLNQWWAGIGVIERVFWFIALPATLVTFIQLILQFTGFGAEDAGGDSGVDVHVGADSSHHLGHDSASSLRVFTIKGMIIFFTLFGWTGIAMTRAGISLFFTSVGAFGMGFGAMILVAWIFKTLNQLGESGTLDIKNAIGRKGVVYLPIPAEGKGSGQIQIVLQGATQTLDAITYEAELLKTGTKVKVSEVRQDNVLVVLNDFSLE